MNKFNAGDKVIVLFSATESPNYKAGEELEVIKYDYRNGIYVYWFKGKGPIGLKEKHIAKTKGENNMNNIKKLHKEIKNIYFNEEKRTTVIVFKNGDRVKATSSKETPFSEYAGFVTALFKYEHGLKLKNVEHLIKKKGVFRYD